MIYVRSRTTAISGWNTTRRARDGPVSPSRTELDAARPAMARDNVAFDKVERMQGNVGYLTFRVCAYPYLARRLHVRRWILSPTPMC